jgi:hypothetical protein
MGVDYNAVIGIGKEFYDKYEAIDFLESHNVLTDEDRNEIEEDGFSEWLYNNTKVEGRLLNYYSGDYYFVGYELSCGDPESFRKSFEEGMENWDSYFPDVAPEVIKTVQVC